MCNYVICILKSLFRLSLQGTPQPVYVFADIMVNIAKPRPRHALQSQFQGMQGPDSPAVHMWAGTRAGM